MPEKNAQDECLKGRQCCLILQTCLPDYRLPLFENLCEEQSKLKVFHGGDYFTPGLQLCDGQRKWAEYVPNRFLFRRKLLWQSNAIGAGLAAGLLIAEFNPRIISTWWLLLMRSLLRRPTLLWGHLWGYHSSARFARPIRLLMLGLSSGFISYSRIQAAEYLRLRPASRVWVASNSCVTNAQCKAAPDPDGKGCVTYVGRLIKSKKPAILLEAFARIIPRLPPDAKLKIVGDGPERAFLGERVKQLGLITRVEILGHVNERNSLAQIYARSLVAVSPGYVGLSAIQCMAAGVPMLVSRNEPHSPEIEACVEGRTCEFFTTDNVQELADKLVLFFSPNSPWRMKRQEISEFIAGEYTFERMVGTFQSAISTFNRHGERLDANS